MENIQSSDTRSIFGTDIFNSSRRESNADKLFSNAMLKPQPALQKKTTSVMVPINMNDTILPEFGYPTPEN